MTTTRQLGEVRSYECLHGILRARAVELGITREHLDQIAGVQNGYSAKVLAPRPNKRLGSRTMGWFLPALAIKLIAIEDTEALERLLRFEPKRRAECAKHAGTVSFTISRRELRRRQRKGGENSRKNLSPEHRTKIARKAGMAGAAARWGKHAKASPNVAGVSPRGADTSPAAAPPAPAPANAPRQRSGTGAASGRRHGR